MAPVLLLPVVPAQTQHLLTHRKWQLANFVTLGKNGGRIFPAPEATFIGRDLCIHCLGTGSQFAALVERLGGASSVLGMNM